MIAQAVTGEPSGKSPPLYFSGLDLGQAQDYSALACLERTTPTAGQPAHYALRHLQRWPLGTSYTAICNDLARLFENAPLTGSTVAIDQGGVGAAVIEMVRRSKIAAILRPVLITSGHAITIESGVRRVPKKELVSVLQVLLQSRRLQVARSLPEAAILVKELEMFRVKTTVAGNETFEALRERDHDDMVLALAIAAHEAERFPPRRLMAYG